MTVWQRTCPNDGTRCRGDTCERRGPAIFLVEIHPRNDERLKLCKAAGCFTEVDKFVVINRQLQVRKLKISEDSRLFNYTGL